MVAVVEPPRERLQITAAAVVAAIKPMEEITAVVLEQERQVREAMGAWGIRTGLPIRWVAAVAVQPLRAVV